MSNLDFMQNIVVRELVACRPAAVGVLQLLEPVEYRLRLRLRLWICLGVFVSSLTLLFEANNVEEQVGFAFFLPAELRLEDGWLMPSHTAECDEGWKLLSSPLLETCHSELKCLESVEQNLTTVTVTRL